ncbi:MAG: hypothetical protein KDA72_17065 [Planctomycetales bacterium]|nr:hypothetical protein [Planctomycetales bacterium]
MKNTIFLALIGFACVSAIAAPSRAQDATKIELADGKIEMAAPADWKKIEPKSRIVTYEFSAPADAKEGDEKARITIMPAGGSVEENIQRWYGQFEQPDGKATKAKATIEKFDVDGLTVHWVDIPGSFKDSMGGGPFSGGKTVLRKDYRMLGAIIITKDQGQYFIKMTGHKDVVAALADGFKKSLKELKTK